MIRNKSGVRRNSLAGVCYMSSCQATTGTQRLTSSLCGLLTISLIFPQTSVAMKNINPLTEDNFGNHALLV